MPRRTRRNPFYFLLVVVGVSFCVTACGYTVLAVRDVRGVEAGGGLDRSSSLLDFLDRYGVTVMIAEVAVLGLLTVAAIGGDRDFTEPAKPDAESRP